MAALVAIILFMSVDLKGNLGYVLPRRGVRVGAMLLVAVAVGVSTLLFQTVTANRILTPSIMGFDALYMLIQTALVFTLGASTVDTAPPALKFAAEVALMVVFSGLLYRWLFTGGARSLHLMLLVGIVLGTLFRGFSGLLQRLMEPSEFIILQDLFFASFNQVDPALLAVSAAIVGAIAVGVWRCATRWTCWPWAATPAINLGVDHRRAVTRRAGPVLGAGGRVHRAGGAGDVLRPAGGQPGLPALPQLLPRLAAADRHLLGVMALVGGQLVLEQVFGFATALSVIIEFTGGLLFLYLLLKGSLK